MTGRSVFGHLVVAAATLAAAFAVYLRTKAVTTTADQVVLYEARKKDVVKLVWGDPDKTVTLERRAPSSGEPYWWIISDEMRDGKRQPRGVRASSAAERLVDSFAPLRANRQLGALTEDKRKEMGLAESKKTVTVATASGERAFTVGEGAYGSDLRYVQDSEGKVFLVRGFALGDLENAASRMVERNLYGFPRTEIDRVGVEVGGRKVELVQKSRLEPGKAFWARSSDPEKRDEFAGNWMDKLLGLTAVEYQADEPKGAEVLKVTFRDSKGELGSMAMLRMAAADGKTGDYFAKTAHTVTWVKLYPVAEEIEKDVGKLLETPK